MTTICSFCGREVDEENEINKDKRYLICKCNKGMIPKGANSYKSKGGKNKMETKVKSNILICSVCGSEKKAGKKRIERWKNKEYICMKCRKIKKEE